MLTHVNYRTGRMHDMADVDARRARGRRARRLGPAHSAGAVPVDLNGAGADFAVGCGYKYLNGGPGRARLRLGARSATRTACMRQPLSGWMGHAAPFDFDADVPPGDGIARFLCGTPPVLSLAALECGARRLAAASAAAWPRSAPSRSRSPISSSPGRGSAAPASASTLVTPRDAAQRGSQVELRPRRRLSR